MIDWADKVTRRTPVCSRSGEPIGPGDTIYSSLVFHGEHCERRDMLAAHWREDDATDAASWWIQRLPPTTAVTGGLPPIDTRQLLAIFNDLTSSRKRPQQCLAYALALLLLRAKKLRFVGVEEAGPGQVHLLYEDRSDRAGYRLIDPGMNETELERVQNELLDLMGYAPSGEDSVREA